MPALPDVSSQNRRRSGLGRADAIHPGYGLGREERYSARNLGGRVGGGTKNGR